MYPLTYYETFMRYEASDEVFVAMPFSRTFQQAYETIIEPAIIPVRVNGKPLKPRIINRGTTGSPDIHEQIFDAILHARLVIADLTVQSSYTGDDGASRWQANANVAFEVGLASAWRNPEDILLIHQEHQEHSYSFDIQNLRHVSYDTKNKSSSQVLTEEIVRAINQSTFLAQKAFQKIIQTISPSAIQYMYQESRRAFPMISFHDTGMPIMDTRVHAASELLSFGALKNRNVIRQGIAKGVLVLFQWTELGLRMMLATRAIDQERRRELKDQIASVPEDAIPPKALMEFQETKIIPGETKGDSEKNTCKRIMRRNASNSEKKPEVS